MLGNANTKAKVVGLFLLGCILFSYPVMTLFNRPVFLLGIPLLFIYIFLAWIAVIALVFALAHTHLRSRSRDAAPGARLPRKKD